VDTINFLVAGVGGQGTLLASDIMAEVGLQQGLDVKKSDVHGMSQRGGAVTSHVRWGEHVASPLCEKGKVDYFIAQELLEALRWLEYLKPGGTVVVSRQVLPPTSTVFGTDQYPPEDQIIAKLRAVAGKLVVIDAPLVAERLGNRRAANSVLLGALSKELPQVPQEAWLAVVEDRVPERHRAVNRAAFLAGAA